MRTAFRPRILGTATPAALVVVVVFALVAMTPRGSAAQGPAPASDAGTLAPFASTSASAAPSSLVSAAVPPTAPLTPPAASTESKPKPDPGPSVRERGSRTRRGNPASGALFLVIIIGTLGWYVIKRLRRR